MISIKISGYETKKDGKFYFCRVVSRLAILACIRYHDGDKISTNYIVKIIDYGISHFNDEKSNLYIEEILLENENENVKKKDTR